jgi:hypothetical protein
MFEWAKVLLRYMVARLMTFGQPRTWQLLRNESKPGLAHPLDRSDREHEYCRV